MTNYVVSTLTTNLAVGGTDTAKIVNGGTLTSSTVAAGGVIAVSSGGINISSTVLGKDVVSSGGLTSAIIVGSGGEQIVSNGGYASGTTVKNSGTEIVSSGGYVYSTTVSSGGLMIVSNGGQTGSSVILNGAFEVISAGGSGVGDAIGSGGEILVSAGGSAINSFVGSGGNEIVVSGGFAVSAVVLSGGVVTVQNGGFAVSATVVAGGQVMVFSGGEASASYIFSGGAQNVQNGGLDVSATVLSGGVETLSAGGHASATKISSGGTETILSGGISINVVQATGGVINIASGGEVDEKTLAFVGAGSGTATNGTLTVTQGGHSVTLDFAGNPTGEFYASADGSGGTLITYDQIPCFAEGTKILTSTGEIAVQNLREGMMVPAFAGAALRRIAWVGSRQVDIARHPDAGLVSPVCILAGSIAPGMPARDLRLSPQHALFLRDDAGLPVLVPVRHLINGATIRQEKIASVTYYHVELADLTGSIVHDVVLADGMPVESYLDTGNRHSFAHADQPRRLIADFAPGPLAATPCAEIVTHGPRLAALARRFGAGIKAAGFGPDSNPNLILLGDGAPIEFAREGDIVRAMLPAGVRQIVVVSRVFVPALNGTASDDARALGIGVAGLQLDGIDMALTDPCFVRGWHSGEDDVGCGVRWSTGEGVILARGARMISLRLAEVAPHCYWQAPGLSGLHAPLRAAV